MIKKFGPRHKSQFTQNIVPAVRDSEYLDNRTWPQFSNGPDHPLFLMRYKIMLVLI
jgi:hypothetical protein